MQDMPNLELNMRNITYKKKESLEHRRKLISICENSEDKECKTYVRKSFIYIVSKAQEAEAMPNPPEVFIKKRFDTKSLVERFSFKVKGSFFINRDGKLLKVDFCHTLRINIIWKSKIFSPKKSVTLT
jgi:hypothetical protein